MWGARLTQVGHLMKAVWKRIGPGDWNKKAYSLESRKFRGMGRGEE